jgi:DUF1680 family protein
VQVNGFAAAFEKAQDDVGYAAVSNFFEMVTRGHSYASGGSNDHEYWGPPRAVADALLQVRDAPRGRCPCSLIWRMHACYTRFHLPPSCGGLQGAVPVPRSPTAFNFAAAICRVTGCAQTPVYGLHAHAQQEHATETEETCTQYNMLKIARYLFRWTGAPAFLDYYERAILNGAHAPNLALRLSRRYAQPCSSCGQAREAMPASHRILCNECWSLQERSGCSCRPDWHAAHAGRLLAWTKQRCCLGPAAQRHSSSRPCGAPVSRNLFLPPWSTGSMLALNGSK